MITKDELHDVMVSYLKPKLDECINNGGYWNNGSYAGLFYWYLNSASSFSHMYIGSRIIIENDEIIGFDIYNTYSDEKDYVNIKIRKNNIEFIEDSKFVDFDKEFMYGLYRKIVEVTGQDCPIEGTMIDNKTDVQTIDISGLDVGKVKIITKLGDIMITI